MSSVVGRFAPSPTGPLHFGSVVTAVASYLSARSQAGRWLVRIDDLDRPREVQGAADAIIATLGGLALEWDGPITYQSLRSDAYRAALAELEKCGAVFHCGCTRAMVGRGAYPGTCRAGLPPGRRARSVRVRVDSAPLTFGDAIQGTFSQLLADTCGDFVVRRADGIYAYHLAVVVDDAEAGVTEVVRGLDLIESTPRQIHLQHLLGLPSPHYAHVGIVLDARGVKLSKQTRAAPVTPATAPAALYHALCFLGLDPGCDALGVSSRELLAWALPRWPGQLPVAARHYSFPLS